MAAPRLDLSVPNNVDWLREFSIQVGSAGAPPWAGRVPAWEASGEYRAAFPASVVVFDGDLYMAAPAEGGGTWIAAGTFEAERERWLLIGARESYGLSPYDLSGASLKMQIAKLEAGDLVKVAAPVLTLSSEDGTLVAYDAMQGGVRLSFAAAKASAIPAGVYAYDLVIIHRDGVVVRGLYGNLTVEQGISR